jgi:predicted SAM-dependent methyltransferase
MEQLKLHLGCGPNVKEGYVNIDGYVTGEGVVNMDILNLGYPENSADEILAEHLFEHLPFKDEEQLFKECYRVLKPGGVLIVETPDMEWLCTAFLQANDEFTSFYQAGAMDHYFGHGKSYEHRWGMITTHFFGNQNGEGQFHKNGYTKQKFIDIAHLVGFSSCEVLKLVNKGAGAIRARIIK